MGYYMQKSAQKLTFDQTCDPPLSRADPYLACHLDRFNSSKNSDDVKWRNRALDELSFLHIYFLLSLPIMKFHRLLADPCIFVMFCNCFYEQNQPSCFKRFEGPPLSIIEIYLMVQARKSVTYHERACKF